MPNAVPPPATDAEKTKMESAVSSAAASPAPSVASSKDDKVRTSKSADGKDKDLVESSVEDSVDADLMDVDKKPETMDTAAEPVKELLASDDIKQDLSEKLERELKKEEQAEEADSKEDIKEGECTSVNSLHFLLLHFILFCLF